MNSTYGHGDVSNKMKTCRVSPLAFTAILSLPFTLSPGRPCIKACLLYTSDAADEQYIV